MKKIYRLFAFPYDLKNVEYASKFRFSRVTPDYILVYAMQSRVKPPVGKPVEIKESDLKKLDLLDESWLFDCGISLFADIASRQKKEDITRLTDMIDRLEIELEKEAGGEEG